MSNTLKSKSRLPNKRGTEDRKQKLAELSAKIDAMTPEERHELIQKHFTKTGLGLHEKLKPFTKVALFEALIRSFQTSIKFEEAKKDSLPEDNAELNFRNTFVGMDTVPGVPEDNPPTGTGRSRKRTIN